MAVQPGKKKAQEDLTSLSKHLRGGCIEDRARLLLVVPSGRTTDDGHKLKHRRFPLNILESWNGFSPKGPLKINIRKHLFTVEVTKHWQSLPREVVESSSLEILRSSLDMVLGNRL